MRTRAGKHGIWIAATLFAFTEAAAHAADSIWLDDGTRIDGEVLDASVPGAISMTVSWSPAPIEVKSERARRIALAPREEGVAPDFVIGLTNGVCLPCTLVRLDNDAAHVRQVDGTALAIPWTMAAFFKGGVRSVEFFSGASNTWDLGEWDGDKKGWIAGREGIRRIGHGGENKCMVLPLSDKAGWTTSNMRLGTLSDVNLLLARHRQDKAKTIGIEFEAESPGVLSLKLEHGGQSFPAPLIPDRDLDMTVQHEGNTVSLLLEGVIIAREPLPDDYAPVLGFGGQGDILIKSLAVVVETGVPDVVCAAPEKTIVSMANGDTLTVSGILFAGNSLKFELHGNEVQVPLDSVRFVRFPRAIQENGASLHTVAEVTGVGMRCEVERIMSIRKGCISARGADGSTRSLPLRHGASIVLLSDEMSRGPESLARVCGDAMVRRDFARMKECLFGPPEMIDDIGRGMPGDERIDGFEMKFKSPGLLGRQALAEVLIRTRSAARDGRVEDWEEDDATIFFIRHKGRWYMEPVDW